MPAPVRAGTAMWFDLAVADLDAAKGFYQEFLGWALTEHETPMGVYVTGSVEAGDVGGMMTQDPDSIEAGVPPSWTVVFAVEDIDREHPRVLDLGGGTLAEPFEIPGGDRIAFVTDPTGATFAIMETSQIEGIAWGELGAASWVECHTRDPDAARSFYESFFGWKQAVSDTGYVVFEREAVQVAGLMEMPAEVPPEVPAYWMVYWTVDDVDGAVARASELGATVVVPPMTVEGMRFGVVEDPLGAVSGLITPQARGQPARPTALSGSRPRRANR